MNTSTAPADESIEAVQSHSLRKLIFYSSIAPDRDGAWSVFSLARRAAEASLEVEIYLAGAATGLMRRDVRDGIDGRPRETLHAVLDARVPISIAPE